MSKFYKTQNIKFVKALLTASILGITTAGAQYCTPSGALDCSSFNDAITNVTINTLNNTTSCGTGGYTIYTTPTTSLTQGVTYPITVEVGDAADRVAVWIDFNNNNTFDASEYFALGTASTANVCSGSIVIPAGATTGARRMRVREKWNAIPISTEACTLTGTWGEVEDYTVTIVSSAVVPPACLANPVAPTNNSSTVCSGNTLLRWNKAATATGYDVYLNTGTGAPGTVVSSNQPDTFFTATTAVGSYVWKVVPRNSAGPATATCGTWAFTTIPSVTPSVTAVVSPNDTLCPGVSAVYTATPTNGGTAPVYQWKKNSSNVGTNSPVYTDNTIANNDIVSVVMTSNVASCLSAPSGSSMDIKMTVLTAPPATISANGPLAFCYGNSVTLSTSTPGTAFEWLFNNVPMAGTNNSNYAVTYTGYYRVRVTGNTKCPAISDSILVTVYPTPFPLIDRNNMELSAATTYTSYQWYRNGQPIPNAISFNYTLTRDGTYKLFVTDVTGCGGWSVDMPVNSLTIPGVNTPAISIYPNPARNQITVKSDIAVNVAIHSVDGKVVLQQKEAGNVDISSIANGIYLLYITDDQNRTIKVEKLVKQFD